LSMIALTAAINFSFAKFDIATEEAKVIQATYGTRGWPTYLFLDTSLTVVHRDVGYCSAIEFLQRGKDTLDPEKQFRTLQNKFEDDSITMEELDFYIKLRED
ncbi:MAG: hypothetical protein Q8880_12370, partial [Bacteroidota bacterium]|nr:hypothetical protein [Bacteroidota bacterium]